MFKFFRKYNKIILVWGGVVLMIAFLVPQSLTQCSSGGGDYTLGTTSEGKVTEFERRGSAYQLDILGRLPLMGQLAAGLTGGTGDSGGEGDNAPLKWTLMLRDAQRLGVSASPYEVDVVLSLVQIDDAALTRMAKNAGTSPDTIRGAVRNWLILDRYAQLVRGDSFTSAIDRLRLLGESIAAYQQGNIRAAYRLHDASLGGGRLSSALVEHYLQEQGATVWGEAVLVGAGRYLDQIDPPSDADLATMFDDYRSSLPGTEPYGFGYRAPDRVKIEYMVIPLGEAEAQVQVEEAEVYEYYEKRKGEMANTPGAPAIPPYSEVREQIVTGLRQQKAESLADQMTKAALATMFEAQRRLEEKSGYKIVPEDFEPIDLQRVADDLALQFKVRPQVYNDTQQWTAVADLDQLPGLSYAMMQRRPQVSMAEYVLSAKEMEPASDNVLVPERLQVGLSATPVIGMDGSRIVFRLTAAEPARDPASLDEVREQVVQDAKMYAAYNKLLADRTSWRDKAAAGGLTEVAAEVGASVITIPPTVRREPGPDGMQPPLIRDIGRSESFVSAMFERAGDAAQTDGGFDASPTEAKMGAAGVDRRLSLAVFEVQGYRPITRSQFTREAGQLGLPRMIDATLLLTADDPLSFDAVAKRVGWKSESYGELIAEEEPAADAPSDG